MMLYFEYRFRYFRKMPGEKSQCPRCGVWFSEYILKDHMDNCVKLKGHFVAKDGASATIEY